MGTEVLQPHNILIRPPQPSFNHNPRRKTLPGNRNPHRKKRPDPPQPSSRRSLSLDDRSSLDESRRFTILRRGQSIGDLDKASSLSPSRADVYAGSAVATSPSPRALPLPSFFSRKVASLSPSSRDDASDDDSAAREIRRLLRLE